MVLKDFPLSVLIVFNNILIGSTISFGQLFVPCFGFYTALQSHFIFWSDDKLSESLGDYPCCKGSNAAHRSYLIGIMPFMAFNGLVIYLLCYRNGMENDDCVPDFVKNNF